MINLNFKDSHYVNEILEFHLPRFDELPNIDLYMDQVLSIIENSLNIFCSETDENIITKSMINNYVKQCVIKKPCKKRYNRLHVSYLIIISVLKRVLSISEISKIINTQDYEVKEFYNMFCCELELSLKETFLDKKNLENEYLNISKENTNLENTNSKFFSKNLTNSNLYNKILVASIRAFSNKVYVQKLIEFHEENLNVNVKVKTSQN